MHGRGPRGVQAALREGRGGVVFLPNNLSYLRIWRPRGMARRRRRRGPRALHARTPVSPAVSRGPGTPESSGTRLGSAKRGRSTSLSKLPAACRLSQRRGAGSQTNVGSQQPANGRYSVTSGTVPTTEHRQPSAGSPARPAAQHTYRQPPRRRRVDQNDDRGLGHDEHLHQASFNKT